jgi:PhzF family phenazine biosynthesis protein
MLTIATDLGYSETAFLTDITPTSARVRYFTPRDEIAFCGHATIAAGVTLGRRGARSVVTLETNAGVVPVEVSPVAATFTGVHTEVSPLDDSLLDELLAALRLSRADLDPDLSPAFLDGGNPHPVLFVRDDVLARLDHDGDAVLRLQDREGWDGTTPVVHRISANRFHSRNPFPRGGIREDPATGSAAAALGAYLRATDQVTTPAEICVEQGSEIGRPSLITVHIPRSGRVQVSGNASEL